MAMDLVHQPPSSLHLYQIPLHLPPLTTTTTTPTTTLHITNDSKHACTEANIIIISACVFKKVLSTWYTWHRFQETLGPSNASTQQNVVHAWGDREEKGEVEFRHTSCHTITVPDHTTVATQCEACPSCSTSTALASIITAIATSLLATVISVLVMIAVCKCHPKFTPGEAETGTSAGGEGHEYEEVDGGGGGVAVSDPTYMEVDGGGGRGGGNTIKLKENEAYASTIHKIT